MKASSVWLFTISLSGLVLLVVITASFLGVRNRIDQVREAEVWIPLDRELTQTFSPEHDFLNIVIIPFKNPGLENESPHLFQIKNREEVLVEMPFSGMNAGDPGPVKFQFEPLGGVMGRELALVVQPQEEAETPLLVGRGEDSLAFTAFYRTVNKKQSLVNSLKGAAQRLGSDSLFLVAWVVLLAASAGGTVWRLKKTG